MTPLRTELVAGWPRYRSFDNIDIEYSAGFGHVRTTRRGYEALTEESNGQVKLVEFTPKWQPLDHRSPIPMPLPTPSANIALFIDADNAPAAKIDFIIAELASYGVVNIRRAYGNWKKSELSGWENVLHDYAIRPVQHFDLVKGKNASDMALLVDAMDILYTKNVDVFCIVSSDADFTPLVLRLRAEGKTVIGFGNQKAAAPFVNSCSRFLYLDQGSSAKGTKTDKGKLTGKDLKGDAKLMNTLRSAVTAATGENDWANLGVVGAHIANQGSFDSRNHGYAKLSELFAAIDLFETKYLKDDNGGTHLVRLKPKK